MVFISHISSNYSKNPINFIAAVQHCSESFTFPKVINSTPLRLSSFFYLLIYNYGKMQMNTLVEMITDAQLAWKYFPSIDCVLLDNGKEPFQPYHRRPYTLWGRLQPSGTNTNKWHTISEINRTHQYTDSGESQLVTCVIKIKGHSWTEHLVTLAPQMPHGHYPPLPPPPRWYSFL